MVESNTVNLEVVLQRDTLVNEELGDLGSVIASQLDERVLHIFFFIPLFDDGACTVETLSICLMCYLLPIAQNLIQIEFVGNAIHDGVCLLGVTLLESQI